MVYLFLHIFPQTGQVAAEFLMCVAWMCRFIEVDWAKVFRQIGHFLSKPFPGIMTQSEINTAIHCSNMSQSLVLLPSSKQMLTGVMGQQSAFVRAYYSQIKKNRSDYCISVSKEEIITWKQVVSTVGQFPQCLHFSPYGFLLE